jgi:hypothetical protein
MRASHSAVAILLLCGAAARADDDTSPPVIAHTPATRGERGKPTPLTARITDESKIFPQVFYRFASSGPYERPLDMKPVKGQKAQWTATLPPPPGNVLEYYIEAYDEFGNGPARAGDPERPFRIDFAPVQIVQTQPTGGAASDSYSQGARSGRGRFWTWLVGGTGLGLLAGGIVANPLGSPRATALDVAGATLLAGSVALYFLEAPRDGTSGGSPRGPRGQFGMAAGPVAGGGAVCVAGRF